MSKTSACAFHAKQRSCPGLFDLFQRARMQFALSAVLVLPAPKCVDGVAVEVHGVAYRHAGILDPAHEEQPGRDLGGFQLDLLAAVGAFQALPKCSSGLSFCAAAFRTQLWLRAR